MISQILTNKPVLAFNLSESVMHHVRNADEWNLPFVGPLPLPDWLTLHGVMVLLCAVFLILLFCRVYDHSAIIPRGATNLLETLVLFVRDGIVYPTMGREEGRRFMPLLCTYFFFILGLNLMGLIPLFSTATANINVTAALASITLVFMTVVPIRRNGLMGFLKAFIPHGVPVPILFVLIPIEIIGLVIKSFALTIRLFANMMAGHIVILTLIGLVVLLGVAATPSIPLAAAIYVLEILVAFLQAFIFTLLSAIFIGQVLHPDH